MLTDLPSTSAWLGDNDTLAGTPAATITPLDTVTIQDVVVDGAQVTVWVSGGTIGLTYVIQIEGITTRGRDCLIRGSFLVEP